MAPDMMPKPMAPSAALVALVRGIALRLVLAAILFGILPLIGGALGADLRQRAVVHLQKCPLLPGRTGKGVDTTAICRRIRSGVAHPRQGVVFFGLQLRDPVRQLVADIGPSR